MQHNTNDGHNNNKNSIQAPTQAHKPPRAHTQPHSQYKKLPPAPTQSHKLPRATSQPHNQSKKTPSSTNPTPSNTQPATQNPSSTHPVPPQAHPVPSQVEQTTKISPPSEKAYKNDSSHPKKTTSITKNSTRNTSKVQQKSIPPTKLLSHQQSYFPAPNTVSRNSTQYHEIAPNIIQYYLTLDTELQQSLLLMKTTSRKIGL